MRKTFPLLSVIVPVYNGQEYLKETINAILSSSYSNIELIIVDDGSVDQSEKIYTEIAEKDNRLRIFKKENGGIVSARNYGIDRAKGDYICFCDQDDLVVHTMYATIIDKMTENCCDIGFCSTGKMINTEITSYENYRDGLYEKREDIWYYLLYPLLFHEFKTSVDMSKQDVYPSIWKCIFEADFFKKKGLYCRRFIDYEDDLILFAEALSKADRVCVISEMLYIWRINIRSESNRKKYIQNLKEKQVHFVEYMCSILLQAQVPGEVIEWYRRVAMCRTYLELLNNLQSPISPLSFKEKLKRIKKDIYNADFENCKEAIPFIENKYLRVKCECNILRLRVPSIVYLLTKLVNRLIRMATSNAYIVKIERKIK